MSKEAMKLALEALEAGEYYIDDLEAIVYAADDLGTHEDRAKMQAAITALREALAEQALDKKAENARELGLDYEPAQQEPVFWYRPRSDGMYEGPLHNAQIECVRKESGGWTPLYTTPQPAQRKPLTEYEIDCIRFGITAAHHTEHAIKLTRAIEAAHGIKEKNI